jgi:hypothetical protein
VRGRVQVAPAMAVIAIFGAGTSGCGGSHGVFPVHCCPAGLIDPSKLLRANLPGAPLDALTLALEYGPSQPFDLAQLLQNPIGDMVLWSVDGVPLNDALLRLKSGPPEDMVLTYAIAAIRPGESVGDGFTLISFPATTRERFSSWYEHERTDLSWLSLLPPVYSSLGPGLSDPEPTNCSRKYWEGVHKLDSRFHPGGAYEMRSKPVGGEFGHQAVYDSNGQLIREGSGAGSADKGAPKFWAFGLVKHRDRDVRPYVWAAQLDGNPVNPSWMFLNFDSPLLRIGVHMMHYQNVRPALWGRSPEILPETCISQYPH